MKPAVELGSLFYELREDTYLTQQQLADMLGVSQPTVSHWEAGKCLPRQHIMESIDRVAPGYAEEMRHLWRKGRREIYRNGQKRRGENP